MRCLSLGDEFEPLPIARGIRISTNRKGCAGRRGREIAVRRGSRNEAEKAWLPFVSNAIVVAGRLVTGPNRNSAKAAARPVAALLKRS